MLRTEHVGSLLRPRALLDARLRFSQGDIGAAALRAAEDEAVLGALRAQERTGIGVVTDGEFRRTDFRAGFAAAVSGLRQEEFRRPWKSAAGQVMVTSRLWRAVAPLRQTAPIATGESRFLAANTRAPYKITLPAPGFMAARFFDGREDSPYRTVPELARALGGILRDEAESLVADGVSYIQIDNPGYASFLDPSSRARMTSAGQDPDRALDEMLEPDRARLAAAGARGGVTLAVHICRGNNASSWMNEGSYEPIAEKVFSSLPADRFLLEFDDSRSGGFECLRFVPEGKTAVLGLVSTKVTAVEEPEELMRRLDEAARYLDPSQAAISPQCGFATHAEGGNHLSEDEQYRKLSTTAEAARRWFGDN
jgi:5-methyltetrahydropteroyltriglutamate--homocysteine methyltransferase